MWPWASLSTLCLGFLICGLASSLSPPRCVVIPRDLPNVAPVTSERPVQARSARCCAPPRPGGAGLQPFHGGRPRRRERPPQVCRSRAAAPPAGRFLPSPPHTPASGGNRQASGGRPFLSASSFPHSAHGSSLGPHGPHAAASASLPRVERRGRAAPARQDRGEHEGADSAKPAGDTSGLPAFASTHGPCARPEAGCSWAGPRHKGGRGGPGTGMPLVMSPVPQAVSPAGLCALRMGTGGLVSGRPGNVPRLDAGPEAPSTHPVSTHRICRLLHRPPPHRRALRPSSFYR